MEQLYCLLLQRILVYCTSTGNSLGMSVSKSFEDDEDDFNESSLIHTRIPGKKVKVTQINYISRNQLHLTAISASWVKRQNIAGLCQQTFQFSW